MNWWNKFIKKQYEFLFKEDIDATKQEINSLKEMIENSKTKIEIPKILGNISIFELSDLLRPYCKEVYLCDKNYSLTSVIEAKKFSIETSVFTRKFMDEKSDCDNYSGALHGYWNTGLEQFAFGIALSANHAFNIFINEKKEIFIVEPQSNKFMPIEETENDSMYFPLRMILL